MKKNIFHLITLITLFLYYLIVKFTSFYIPCIFHEIASWYCPGCGVTRMILCILKGDLVNAFKYNQFIFITGPIIAFLYADTIISNFRETTPIYKKIPNIVYYIYLILLIIFTIYRNLHPEITNFV